MWPTNRMTTAHSAATNSAMKPVSAICSRVLDRIRSRSRTGSNVRFLGKIDRETATVCSDTDAVATGLLGGIEPLVRHADQLFERAPVDRIGCNPAADRHIEHAALAAIEADLGELRRHSRQDLARALRPLAVKCDDELLAAPPAAQILEPKAGAEQRAKCRQHLVADPMTIGVIHQLEAIDVHQAQRQMTPRALR